MKPTLCGTNKNQVTPITKNIEYLALEVSLSIVDIGNINKYAHNYSNMINYQKCR